MERVDNANMAIVLGDTGFIVIDSQWIAEAPRASIDLARALTEMNFFLPDFRSASPRLAYALLEESR
jgi:hypothetical protein